MLQLINRMVKEIDVVLNTSISFIHTIRYDYLLHNITTIATSTVYSIVNKREISTIISYANKFKFQIHCLLYITFFKYNVYDLYYIFKQTTFDYTQIQLILLYTIHLFLLTINIKPIVYTLKQLDLRILQHQICSYTMMINSAIIIYNVGFKYIVFQISSCILAVSSYVYHQNIIIDHNGIIPKKPKWIIYDITAIHLFVLSYISTICDYWYMLVCIHGLNIYYIDKKIPEDYIAASFPAFTIDIITIIINNFNIEIYTFCVLSFCAHAIQPFYDLTFSYIHMLIIWFIYVTL